MDKLYLTGELLQLYTKDNRVVEGRFHSITNDKSKISLYQVKELPQGDKRDGICFYYDCEVTNIIKIREPLDVATAAIQYMKISQKECEDIIRISKKYIFINTLDSNYREAIEHLSQQSFIAVSTDGASMGRKCKMPFLVVSSSDQIYIFDIQVMQFHAFDAGLKKLLQSEVPKKNIHDSRKISDCLYHKHNVELKSVFDTQVADLIVTKNKYGHLPSDVKSLQDCLYIYMGLPKNIIEDKFDIVQCTARPLALNIKDALAKNIAYLHRLSEIVNDEMLMPFTRGVEFYITHLRSSDEYKAWELCGKHNQLPKEFNSSIEY